MTAQRKIYIMKQTNDIEILYTVENGDQYAEEVDSDVFRKFLLIYGKHCKIARAIDREKGIKPSGYELDDWFINKELEDEKK